MPRPVDAGDAVLPEPGVTGVHDGVFGPGTDIRLEAAQHTWLGAVVQWAVQQHMTVDFGRGLSTPPYEGDLNLKEHVERIWKPKGGGGTRGTGGTKEKREEERWQRSRLKKKDVMGC